MLTEQATALLYGKPLVKPSTIESELEKIRNAAAVQDAARDAERGGSTAPRVRATLKNVLLLNTQRGKIATDTEIDRLIDKLCIAHPSRFFVVDGNLARPEGDGKESGAKESESKQKDKQPGLLTSVSSRCFLADSGAHVCSEEIYVSASAATVSLVPNLLISLLAPDVDTVLLILGDICDARPEVHQLLGGMVGISDLIIYDSSEFGDYQAGSRMILSALSPRAGNGDSRSVDSHKLYDLNWPRLRRWRALVAEGFDAERFVSASDNISRAHLSVVGTDIDSVLRSSEGLLIAGWLLSSLRLAPESRAAASEGAPGFTVTCLGERKRQVKLEITAGAAEGGEALALSKVEVEVSDPSFHGRIAVSRRFDKGTAEIAMGLTEGGVRGADEYAGSTVRSLPFPTPEFADKVLAALVARRPETAFQQVLELSLKLSQLYGKSVQ